jgi:predicted nucleic acid-binding protein
VLQALFQVVHVPISALAEYAKHGVRSEVHGLIRSGFFKTHKLWPWEQRRAQALSQQIATSSLSRDPVPSSHRVDAEVIVLAQRRVIGAHYVLIDELAAREIARAYPVPVMGLVGVLRIAFEQTLLTADEIEQALRECQRQGTHYSNALIEQFVRSLRESSA